MPLHPQAALFLKLIAAAAEEPRPAIAQLRAGDGLAAYRGEAVTLPEVRDVRVATPGGSVPVRVYRPEPGDDALPAVVYFHGGGWVLGSVDRSDTHCRAMAALAGCVVVSVDYRLAPEHPFPAALDEACAATRDVLTRLQVYGADPARVAVWGDSAGGGGDLAAVVARLLRDEGACLAHQLLVYPVTDTARDTPSYRQFAQGYGLDAAEMAWFIGHYVHDADGADPRISPLRAADLSGLCPATVITAEYDVLRDEGEAYARALQAAGVPTELRRVPGVTHGFFSLPGLFDAATQTRAWAAARLRAAFGAGEREAGV